MKLKLHTLVNRAFLSALQKLGNTPMSLKEGYALAKTLRQVELEVNAFEKARQLALRKHGTPLPSNPDMFELLPGSPNAVSFTADMEALLLQEIEIPLLGPITVDWDAISMTPTELSMLLDLLVPPTDPKPAQKG